MNIVTFTTTDGRYLIESHGKGWAYSVFCENTLRNFWVQDDAAAQLQEDTAGFTDTRILADYFAE
jgi:hypothetical protein